MHTRWQRKRRQVVVDELAELHEHGGEAVGGVRVGVEGAADRSGTGQLPSPHAARPGGLSAWWTGGFGWTLVGVVYIYSRPRAWCVSWTLNTDEGHVFTSTGGHLYKNKRLINMNATSYGLE